MVGFSAITWLILALIGGGAVLGMLHGMALVIRNQKALHELQLKVARLKLKYAAEQAGRPPGGIIEVDEVEEEEPGEVDIVEAPDTPMARAA